jgi:hypothetical protein
MVVGMWHGMDSMHTIQTIRMSIPVDLPPVCTGTWSFRGDGSWWLAVVRDGVVRAPLLPDVYLICFGFFPARP